MTETQNTVWANNDPRFYFRFLLIGIAALGFSLWSLYDGAITYPNQRMRALEYQEIKEKYGDDHAEISRDDKKLIKSEWKERAREQGWPTKPPGEPKAEAESVVQYVMSAVSALVGLGLLLNVWRARSRWIEANETCLTSSWGARVDFDQVVSIDKRRWRDKGIAKIKYEQDGRKKRFVLDNYKFDRFKTTAILYMLESKAGTDKIVRGRPEPPPKDPAEIADEVAAEVANDANASDAMAEKPVGTD